jgi:hypothetical protein
MERSQTNRPREGGLTAVSVGVLVAEFLALLCSIGPAWLRTEALQWGTAENDGAWSWFWNLFQ